MLDLSSSRGGTRHTDWSGELQQPAAPVRRDRALPGAWQGAEPDLQHNVTVDVIDSPMSGEEHYIGSLKHMLMKNKGQEIVASFLVGTAAPVSWQGTLYEVGNDYIVIHQEMYDRYIVGDLYSLKFVEFPKENGSRHTGYRQRDGAAIW